MRILDLDLDFFIQNVETNPTSKRLENKDYYAPWTTVDVCQFLEDNCGLTRNSPRPGAVFELHDEVFRHCRRLIECEELEPPFDLVHIDAHADLGMGDGSWKYVMGKLLHEPIRQRFYPKEGRPDGLDEGNYLLFAIACQWINKLTYVCHPRSREDSPIFHFKDFDLASGCIQLKKYKPQFLEVDGFQNMHPPLELEPQVPFEKIQKESWKEEKGFDFVFLAQSPKYTPPSADRLIAVIEKYIDTNTL